MKNICLILLSFVLLIVCIGCNGDSVSPTDMNTSNVPESNKTEIANHQVNEENLEKNVVQDKVLESEAAASEDFQSSLSEKSEQDELKKDEAEEHYPVQTNLEFASEAQLKSWLKNTTQLAEKIDADILKTMQSGNTISYTRPAIPVDNGMVRLSKITVELSTINYQYQFVDEEDGALIIITCADSGDIDFYNSYKQAVIDQKQNYFSAIENEIEYLCFRNVEMDVVVIGWKQGEVVHSAILEGHYDQLEQILPLLQIEQVTVQTNSNHVTE